MAPQTRRPLIPALLLAFGCAASFGLFAQTLGFGFVYDDYHQLRPYTLAEVGATFHGSWDPTGVEVAFYRPLTAVFYAARFQVLGLDARIYHALSLLMFGFCAGLAGWFVYRACRRVAPALLATAIFAAHPAMPVAQVAWITNQMHLVESLLVLTALHCWLTARIRGGAWWALVFLCAVLTFLVKEDAVMLLPAIFALEVAWRVLVEWRPLNLRRAIVTVTTGLAVVAGLLALRWAMLGAVGGYGWPGWESAGPNFWRGPRAVLAFSRIPPPWRPALFYTNIALFSAAALAALVRFRRVRSELFITVSGLAMLMIFNAPFVLVSKPEQYHLIGLGGVLAMAGAVGILAAAASGRLSRAVWMAGGALAIAMLPGTRVLTQNYALRSPFTLAYDEIVLGWDVVPAELRDAVARKIRSAQDVTTRLGPDLPLVAYGVYGWETNPYGWRFRWTSGRTTLLVTPGARSLVLPVSASVMPAGEPVRLDIAVNGQPTAPVSLTSTAMLRVPVSLSAPAPWWRWPGTTWVEVTVTPTWTPATLDPSSSDRRVLGVMLGAVELVR